MAEFFWNGRYADLLKNSERVEKYFINLTKSINEKFWLKLSIADAKRLCNILTIWYGNSTNAKLLEKKAIPPEFEPYLKMFMFIPKTVKRSLFCEYCAEQFKSELRYNAHIRGHLGLASSGILKCRYCKKNYLRLAALTKHEEECCKIHATGSIA